MKKQTKRECMAVTEVKFCGAVNTIHTCGQCACEKPSPTYIPLCAAHRVMAQVKPIDVFVDRVIAEYRL